MVMEVASKLLPILQMQHCQVPLEILDQNDSLLPVDRLEDDQVVGLSLLYRVKLLT